MPLITFTLPGKDGTLIQGNHIPGKDRQLLFINGFLSKRWGTKSRALAELCKERGWGFCCFDFRGNGDSEGQFSDYTLSHWLDDAHTVVEFLRNGPSLTVVGSSLGGWLTWVVAQRFQEIQRILLLAPAFNMMGKHAQDIPSSRLEAWKKHGTMPWDDDELHKDFPLSWKWVEESESLWAQPSNPTRRIPTTILHGLQDTVITPQGSWDFSQRVFTLDPSYPLELVFKPGDHRFSGPDHLQTLLNLAAQ